jgi:hypothetical protein
MQAVAVAKRFAPNFTPLAFDVSTIDQRGELKATLVSAYRLGLAHDHSFIVRLRTILPALSPALISL